MYDVNKNLNLEDNNWHFVEISKINDKIIKELIKNLNSGLSEDFFISFESLLLIIRGKTKFTDIIESSIIKEINQTSDYNREIFKFLLDSIKNEQKYYELLPQLYNPDFVIRARTLMQIEESRDLTYLRFIIPLVNDPDDSVRWAVIKLLNKLDLVNNNRTVYDKLNNHLGNELNPIIHKELAKILKIK